MCVGYVISAERSQQRGEIIAAGALAIAVVVYIHTFRVYQHGNETNQLFEGQYRATTASRHFFACVLRALPLVGVLQHGQSIFPFHSGIIGNWQTRLRYWPHVEQ